MGKKQWGEGGDGGGDASIGCVRNTRKKRRRMEGGRVGAPPSAAWARSKNWSSDNFGN